MGLGLPSLAYMGFTGGIGRYIILDAIPLYIMTGLGCGACIYATVRSSMTATDIVWSAERRDDYFHEDPKVLEKSKLYGKGLLYQVAKVHSHPEVIPFHSAMVKEVMKDLPHTSA